MGDGQLKNIVINSHKLDKKKLDILENADTNKDLVKVFQDSGKYEIANTLRRTTTNIAPMLALSI